MNRYLRFLPLLLSCFLVGQVVAQSIQPAQPALPTSGQPIKPVIAYVISWSDQMPDPTYLTHINYAFGHVNETFDGVKVDNPARLKQIVRLKKQAPHLKILLSIGGWGSGRFSEMVSDPKTRLAFAKDCAKVVRSFKLDGIDIDWEYPTSNAAGISCAPEDTDNYTLLMRDIRAAIGPDKLLTQATVSSAQYIDMKAVDPYLDFTNVMSYDMGRAPYMNSPLYDSENVLNMTTDKAIQAHLAAGIPPEKLVMGMAFYGRGTRSFPRPADLTQVYATPGFTARWDAEAKNPYMTDAKGQLVYGYENLESLAMKCHYILDHGLKGAMYWSYDGDNEAGDLRRTVYMTLNSQTPKVASPTPQVPVYLDDSKPMDARVADALRQMTTEEKVAMVHAQSKFSSAGVPRLGIPEIWMTDGPHGIRPEVLWDEWDQAGWTSDSCTAFPALTCLAATWNEEMAYLYGQSLGEEARYRKKDVLLGPGVNIYRSPLNGRNFEYMGEDPFLASRIVVPYIKGVQSNGVAACVKHFALNNQETDRHLVDVTLDDRTLYEIYLPAFKAAVQQGGAWALMGSYNRYKGKHNCHNPYLLVDILRKEWGFDGVVVADWGGTHNTMEAIKNGLDMEFGTWTDGLSWGTSNAYDNYYLARPYLKLIQDGTVGTQELDEKVSRILRLAFRTNMNRHRPFGSLATEAHAQAARTIAQEGIVLLRNQQDVLPIKAQKGVKVAVIGENAIKMMTVGGGSSSLKVKHETLPLEGLQQRLEGIGQVTYARGYVGDISGSYNGVTSGQDLNESRSADVLLAEACRVAADADYVVFVGGLNKSEGQDCEGADRQALGLPYAQDRVIEALAEVNDNLIVVLVSGNAVAMPWVEKVPAIVQGWYLGSESGNALADVLLGDVNPSGKLPFTFPVKLEDNGAHALGDFPGKEGQETYREGVLVGYRWHDTKHIEPLFAFGHGLSYTTFEMGTVTADKQTMTGSNPITLSIPVKNTGNRAGAQVVQLYIKDNVASLPRPEKELKGFKKVFLQPGQETVVQLTIDAQALSFFDPEKHAWVAEPGTFEALVGTASDAIAARVSFEYKAN